MLTCCCHDTTSMIQTTPNGPLLRRNFRHHAHMEHFLLAVSRDIVHQTVPSRKHRFNLHIATTVPVLSTMFFSKFAVASACCWLPLLVAVRSVPTLDADTTEILSDHVSSFQQQQQQQGHPIKRHNEFVLLEGHKIREKYHSPLPYTYIQEDDLPVRLCLSVLEA